MNKANVNIQEKTQKSKNSMVETTYMDNKVRKYYAWRASNYDSMSEWEAPYLESLGLKNVQRKYRSVQPKSLFEWFVGRMWGQEIVFAHKEQAGYDKNDLEDLTL